MKKTMRKLLALVLALCLTLGCTGMLASASGSLWSDKLDFTDLGNDPFDWPWYLDYLERAVEHGFMAGTSKTTFSSQSPLTRAQAVTVLARVHKKVAGETPTASGTAPFADVPAGSWYAKTVAWAWEKGLVSGVASDRFAPNKVLTNGELAVIFNKYIRLAGKSGLYEPKPENIGGTTGIPGWVKPHIEAISGFEIWWDEFDAAKTVDRAHGVALFERLYEKLTYPVDNETPRQKFRYVTNLRETADGWIHLLPLGEEPQKLFTSYEDYTAMVEGLWRDAADCRAVEQPAPLTVDEAAFEEYNVLAVELQWPGYGNIDAELASFSVTDDRADIILTQSGDYGSTADITGVIFVVLVPKEVTHAEVTVLRWADWFDAIPS